MKYSFILFILFVSFSLRAQKVYLVDSKASFDIAVNDAVAGDTIQFKNSTTPYTDLSLKIKKTGTKTAPIVFKAQTNGGVSFTGNTQIEIGGSYIVVEGFNFISGTYPDNLIGKSGIVLRSGTSSSDWASNCTVKNITFDGFNH